MIPVERTEADVRAAAAKRVGDVLAPVEGQDMVAAAVRDEDLLVMIEPP